MEGCLEVVRYCSDDQGIAQFGDGSSENVMHILLIPCENLSIQRQHSIWGQKDVCGSLQLCR